MSQVIERPQTDDALQLSACTACQRHAVPQHPGQCTAHLTVGRGKLPGTNLRRRTLEIPQTAAHQPLIDRRFDLRTGKKGMTAFLSVLMALGMLTAAYTVRAASLTAPVFQNPLVAVPPRLMVGVTAFASYNGLMSVAEKKFDPLLAGCEKGSEEYKKLSRKKGAATYGIAAFTAFIGTVTNTGLVCLMIWLCYMVGDMYIASDILPQFFQVTLAVNASIEVAAFTILLPPVVMALSRAGYCRGGKKKR